MTVLAIDTSSRRRVVVLQAEESGLVLTAVVEEGAGVDRLLPRALASLDGALNAVVVVIGPGSFTGVRSGMAAALGVAHARALALHGTGSFDIVAAGATAAGADHGWALVDAGRGGAFAARFSGGAPGEWSRIALEEFVADDLVFSADALPVAGLHQIDPVAGLAGAIPAALTRPPLPPESLRARYPV